MPAPEPAAIRWLRVFALQDAGPALERLEAAVADLQRAPAFSCERGPRGWERLTLTWPAGDQLVIERFWRDEEGVRGELQAWAAWLETIPDNTHTDRLMAHMIQTQEVLTLQTTTQHEVGVTLAGALAGELDGVYQIDGEGIFDSSARLLVLESEGP